MFFSIIVPVYNVERYLNSCLESVQKQKFTDYEIILVDDGSTDSSGAICDQWKCDNINVIHQQNRGLDGARNTGLDMASGEWILFLDSDDELCDGMLSTLYERINRYSADLYCFNMVKMNEEGEVFEKGIYNSEHKTIAILNEKMRLDYYTERLIRYRDSWEVAFRCFRKSIIDEHNLRFRKCSEVFAEDLEFTMEFLLWVDKIQILCDIMYRYRQVQKSIMHTLDQRTILPRLITLVKVFYEQVDRSGHVYIKKNFGKINLGILDFHISYKLDDMSIEEIQHQIIIAETTDRNFKRFMKYARKHAYNNPYGFMLRPWV